MEEYKKETKKAYEKYPARFDQRFKDHFRSMQEYADMFLHHLSGKKVVDLGSGSGALALYFQEQGCDVLCVDFSEAMVQMCKRKGLPAQVMDMEKLRLPEDHYDGVWASLSLLHLPRDRILAVVEQIARILKSQGIFAVSFKEGSKEGFEQHDAFPGVQRWFTYVQEQELDAWLGVQFDVVHKTRIAWKDVTVLGYVLRKRG